MSLVKVEPPSKIYKFSPVTPSNATDEPLGVAVNVAPALPFSSPTLLVMYPPGHARNTECNLERILLHKNKKLLGDITFNDMNSRDQFVERLQKMKLQKDVYGLYGLNMSIPRDIKDHEPIGN